MGADHVILTDQDSVSFSERTFDAAIDAVGHDVPEWMYSSLRPVGRLVVLQEPPNQELANRNGVNAAFFMVQSRREKLEQLAKMIADNQVDVAVARVLPLAAGRAAYQRAISRGGLRGKRSW